ncbi:MAG: anaerobic sulfatase maturase [Planctomycetota bacterium]|nr:MAG: anaerobic sulfatase maturase [Planctomycetota bacterium]
MSVPTAPASAPFHVMTKPIGPLCNLDCEYCFYLEKEQLYDHSGSAGKSRWAMDDAVLESYIRQYIESQPTDEITFAWQGGEPTLLGVSYFQRVVELQQWYCPPGKRIHNALQTNGTLLDDAWCAFFKEHNFLIGLSIDGPRELHDRYRIDKGGKGSFDAVMRGCGLLKQHGVAFNTLTVVHRANAKQPREVYRFLRDIGSGFIQFIPLVERMPEGGQLDQHDLAGPPQSTGMGGKVSPWSVGSQQWGTFLADVWDEWIKADVGKVYVNLFDVQLGLWAGMPSTMCVFAKECGSAVAMEHNGDLYSCDHYVYPEYRLGNISQQHLGDMMRSPQQEAFGRDKDTGLPGQCRRCEYRFACHGECPKHRFLEDEHGEPGLNYLCAGYLHFFRHVDADMRQMVGLLQSQQPPARIMEIKRAQRQRYAGVRPNDPCPCGSGKKFKKCHGRGVSY